MTYNVSGGQIAAARMLLGWSRQNLADRAGCGINTIREAELRGPGSFRIMRRIFAAFEAEGIDFTNRGVDYHPRQLQGAA